MQCGNFKASSATILAVLICFFTITTLAGGSSGGGGGGGYVCFSPQVQAQNCLDAKGDVKPQCAEQILQIAPVEIFELTWFSPTEVPHNLISVEAQDRTWKDYLFRILDGYKQAYPMFITVLKEHVELVEPSKWPTQRLSVIRDLGPRVSNEDTTMAQNNCARLQLAARLPDPESSTGYKFLYDEKWFSLLGNSRAIPVTRIQYQAVLVLHEALYLMNVRLNPLLQNSSSTRNVLEYLISLDSVMRFGSNLRETAVRNFGFRLDGIDRYFELFLTPGRTNPVASSRVSKYKELVQAFLTANNIEPAQPGENSLPVGDSFYLGALPMSPPINDVRPIGKSPGTQGSIAVENRIKSQIESMVANHQTESAFVLVAFDLANVSLRLSKFENIFSPLNGDRKRADTIVCNNIKKALNKTHRFSPSELGIFSGIGADILTESSPLDRYSIIYGDVGIQLLKAANQYCRDLAGLNWSR